MLLDPIVHEYDLVCTPELAFDVYTRRIGEWWHPDYSADPATLQTVTIEAGVGGRWWPRTAPWASRPGAR